MLKKIGTVLCITSGICQPAYSFQLHPTIALVGSYTTAQNFMAAKTGTFDIYNRKVNFGFELTNKFYLSHNYFIKAGLRYSTYSNTVSGKDEPAAPAGQQHLLVWKRNCEHAAVPLQIGKNFATSHSNQGDVFVGVSAGAYLTSSATDQVTSARAINATGTDIVSAQINDMADQAPITLIHTFDFGGSYQPFTGAPRFSVGMMCSIHLNKTAAYAYQGVVNNISRGDQVNYDAQLRQQFINYSVTFSYALGKRAAVTTKASSLSCPE
jgi:hypothetical protein